jgi:hypothetical protein
MRSHGLANFPDPTFPGGRMNISIPSSIDTKSRQFTQAQQTCAKFVPAGLRYIGARPVQEAIAMAVGNRPTLIGFPAEFVATRIGMTWPCPKGGLLSSILNGIPGPIPPNMFESST